MTELAKRAAQQVAEYCGRGTPERLEEIIDSAGVRELTEQHKMDQFWNEEARQVSVRHAKDLEDLTERVRELTEALELSKTRYENVLELLREAVGSDKESGLHYERCICWRCKTLGTLRIIDEAVLARIKGGQ